MSGKVHGFRVKEPRVVSRTVPSPQRGSVGNTSSSLAQAWAAFGEAKSALEKLNPSPPSKSSHAYPPPLAPPPTTSTARETHSLTSSMVNGRGTLHLPGGVERKEKREVFTGKKRGPSLTKTASERASHGVREEGRQRGREEDKKRRKEKDGSLSSSKKATSLHLSTPHSNSTAVFGPPLSFGGTPTSHSKKSPTPGSTDPRPSRVPHSSSTKINLAEDTLATLRSKVEAQKLAVEATNTRLKSLRQPPVTSDPCIYPLPEVTQSSAAASSALPTITTSHSHPPPPSLSTGTSRGASRTQPQSHKVHSTPPPSNNPAPRLIKPGDTSQTTSLPATVPTGGRTGAQRVRKVRQLPPPVDPLRSRRSTSTATSSVSQSVTSRKRHLVREETPPHSRSWALRPSASSIMITASEPAPAVTEPGRRKERGGGVGRKKEERDEERGGRGRLRGDLAQLLQDLESSSGGEGGEGRREKLVKHPPQVPAALKRRRLDNPENEPLPPPPQTKPYDPAEVQRYIRQKQRERRLEARRRQEEEMRGRREREERQKELVQRQRKILQANLRSQQQRWRDSDQQDEFESPHLTLSHPPPHSHTPSPPKLTPHTSPHLPSPHSSTSPHTYTVSPNPPRPQTTSGTSPSPPEEPNKTTGDQQNSHEDRIFALTQSALELKKRIAAEADRLKKARTAKMPGHVNITVTTATPPPSSTTPPTFELSSQLDVGQLPGVGSVHRQARLTEEVRRQGEAATQIQALFRGYRVRRSLATSLGRVGDGEEDGKRTNSVLNTATNGVLNTATNGVLNTATNGVLNTATNVLNFSSPVVSTKPAVASQSVAIQISSSELHLKPTTAASTEEASQPASKVATPPWQKGGGDPLSVINIFTRERSHLQQTLTSLKTQKLSELRQLKTSTPRPPDHTHSSEHPPPAEDGPSNYSYSLSFPSLQSSVHSVPGSTHSLSTHLEESPDSKSHTSSTTHYSPSPHTVTPSPKSHSSHSHSTTATPPQTTARLEEEIPAITPPGSPSFVSSFTATSRPRPADPVTSVTSSDPHRGATGGRLSPRSLGLKLQAELTLLETIEESMRQLSAVEGTRAATSARQETLSLSELMERQRQDHEREMNLAASRARAAEEERQREEERVREREMEIQRAREEVERRERERAAAAEEELSRQRKEISQQLAEARAAASQAVISSAKLQVEAAHNMAISVATAAAKEAVSAAMVGVAHPPLSQPQPDSTPNEPPMYSTDFEESIQPDSLTEEITDTETRHSLLVPTTGGPAGNSSGESTLTPGDSERGGGGGGGGGGGRKDDSQTTVPEEIDGELDHTAESSFRELLPSESHRKRHSRHSSLTESPSRPSSPAHSLPPTPSSLPGDHSPFTPGAEDSFFQFMSRMMEQYMKEEEVRSRHRALLLQLREKALKERTKAEMEWLKLKQQRLRGKGEDEKMPSLETRRRGLLKKLEVEQAEIRRLRQAQKEASRERRLMLEQHRAITHMQSSAQYYREKLRRHSAQDHVEPPFTPSPSHHHSPSPSEVASQVSEEEVSSPIPSQLSYSPSPTPSHHSSSSNLLTTRLDQSASIAMPTDTAETTPTVVHQLRDHDTYLRERKTTADESEVISEVLDHTPSETVPEEVLEEATPTKSQATPTSSQRTTDYSNDSFEPTSQGHTPSRSDHTPSHPPPIAQESESEPTSESTSGVGCLEQRISQLRQQLEERRGEVRRARGEQRQRKRALLQEEENRLRRRLESLDDQLARLQSPAPLQNHLPTVEPSNASPPTTRKQPPPPSSPLRQQLPLPPSSPTTTSGEMVEDTAASALTDHSLPTGGQTVAEEVEEEEEEEGEKSETMETEISELSQSNGEEEDQTSADPFSLLPPEHTSDQLALGQGGGPTEVREEDTHVTEEDEEANGGKEEREESYTESWASDHSSPTNTLSSKSEEPVENKSEREEVAVGDISETVAAGGGVAFAVGQRVLMGGVEPGTVHFVGSTHFAAGVWIGVELDAEKGKNDGSIDDERYFSCGSGHGVFAPPSKVSLLEDEEREEREGEGEKESGGGSEESSVPEEVVEEEWSEGSGVASHSEEEEPSLSLQPRENQGNEEEEEEEETSEGTHPGPGDMAVVEGSRDLEPSSPAVPPPLTLPQEEVPTAPHLSAPPPDIAREAPKQTAEPQTAHLSTSVDHLTSDLVQELANEAFQTMHRIWRHRSPSSPTSPSSPRTNHILETPSGPRRNNHHLRRDLEPTPEEERDLVKSLEQRKREKPELSLKADKISDQLLSLLLKSETDLVCALRSSKSCPEPSSPHRHSSPGLFTPPSLPTIQETLSPPSSPPPPFLPPPSSPPPSPPGSPQRQLPPATAARVAAGERSPPHHRETSPPLTPSLSCASLTSLVDQDDFTSAHCMVPSDSHQIDTIVQHTCSLWNDLRGSSSEPALPPPDCPTHILSLFPGRQLSSNEEHCQEAYIRLVYDTTLQVLRDSAPRDPDVSVWTRFSPALNSQMVAARQRRQPNFDLEKVQRRVRGKMVRGQLPAPLPSAKFLRGMRRVGGKEVDFIDSVLIRELRREESGWVDYHGDETVVKLRVADGLLDSLVTEAVHLITDIAERKRQKHS